MSIQISQEVEKVVWYSHLFQNIPEFVVVHTVKGFGIANKAAAHAFMELSSFFNDPTDLGNLMSASSPFSKSSLNVRKFMYYLSLAWRILSITLLVCEMNANVW